MKDFEHFYNNFLLKRNKLGLLRRLRPVSTGIGSRALLNFSSNDYLGLKTHPALIERSREWAGHFGAGCGSSRLVCGNLDIFEMLEEKTAKFKGREAALVLASGFQANATLLPALFDKSVLGREPLVFSDRLNHASIHHGCAAAGVKQIRYNHTDYDHLQALMEKYCDGKHPAFILSETVFSMDGDMADLTRLTGLAKKFGAMLVVDEAHATGALGPRGAGLAAAHSSGIDIVMGTFSKAMGGFGAYIACSKTMRDYLINRCAGLIYSTALPPAVLGAIDAALDIVPQMDKERAHLQNLGGNLRGALDALGIDCGASQTQIVPALTGTAEAALTLAEKLESNNILAAAIRPPTVPANKSRIRFSLCAAHGEDDLLKLTTVLKSCLAQKKEAA